MSTNEPIRFGDFFSVARSTHVVDGACARIESLAAIKDLRWFCTSWAAPKLSPEESERLHKTLYHEPAKEKDGGLKKRALYIGSSTLTRAKVYVIFPHADRDIRTDDEFLRKWHDLVVRPAFEQAWRQGWDGKRGIPRVPKQYNAMKHDSVAAGKRLHEKNPKTWPEPFSQPLEVEWPSEFTLASINPWDECLDLAWKSMCDTVEDNVDLYEMQGMFLAITTPGFPKGGRTPQEAFEHASKHWDTSFEPTYMDLECFNIFYKTISAVGPAKSKFWGSGYFS
ncbi:hypothetical protein EJ05DRAFT_127901 [Pseudovirgaria hyperparasitica]|uniref:Uncharacterized protein n=1 Tax=Pseudovirgaria hyperparasitica TaxID=470096 RepID=A0A6A6W002_9PEZI|nr:uncharacterized protein EJ05DRAFT_127901 [Pseudovirgaria hyperparasitica]KAF2755260.1 hypothetical protein EJ05DRAFT_127901 [Pseudovirgaria hyperparasitica]